MLKEKLYKITYEGSIYHARVELHESGAQEYGNKTAVHYYDGVNKMPQYFDTRYERGIIDNFDTWADEFIKTRCDKSCIIEAE